MVPRPDEGVSSEDADASNNDSSSDSDSDDDDDDSDDGRTPGHRRPSRRRTDRQHEAPFLQATSGTIKPARATRLSAFLEEKGYKKSDLQRYSDKQVKQAAKQLRAQRKYDQQRATAAADRGSPERTPTNQPAQTNPTPSTPQPPAMRTMSGRKRIKRSMGADGWSDDDDHDDDPWRSNMHDNDDGVQGTSEPKDCTPQQHEEDDAPAMHQDSASEDGFEPLDSYSATITSQRMMVRVSKHTARCVSNMYLHFPPSRRGQRRSGRLRSPRQLAFSL